jgi:sugar lactone lactonase YvrE
MGPSPGWCLGANFSPNYNPMVANTTDGTLNNPIGITGDGTTTNPASNIYVTDYGTHRILRFDASTGAFKGWIGDISTSPTGTYGGGTNVCLGAAVNTFTPGWCLGGTGKAGSADGMLNMPTSITYASTTGYLYVVDNANQRVSSYDAATGAFKGWIGRVNTGSCTGSINNGQYVVANTWCKGTATSTTSGQGDKGGGFYFWTGWRTGIATDGRILYVANFFNYRIDAFDLTTGNFKAAALTRLMTYTNGWTNNPATLASYANIGGCDYPTGLWVDGTGNLYGMAMYSCNTLNSSSAVYKMTIGNPWPTAPATISGGNIVGYQSALDPNNPPTGGDPGCAGATNTTPGWCQGGRMNIGFKLGQPSLNSFGITGDANYVYITDEDSHRVTRIPK